MNTATLLRIVRDSGEDLSHFTISALDFERDGSHMKVVARNGMLAAQLEEPFRPGELLTVMFVNKWFEVIFDAELVAITPTTAERHVVGWEFTLKQNPDGLWGDVWPMIRTVSKEE